MGNDVVVLETEKKAVEFVERATAMQITDNKVYLAADAFCVGLKELEKQIIDHHKDMKEKAWAAHKAAVAAETKALAPVVEARKIVKGKMGAWEDQQAEDRRQEEERLRKEAEKKAAAEREKQAKAALKAGDKELAKEIKGAPLAVAPVVLPDNVPQARTVIQKRWSFRITNPDLVPREYAKPDEVKIGGVIRATKGTVKIPGVEAFEVTC